MPDATVDRVADRAPLSKEGERAALLASVLRHDAARKAARSSTLPAGPKPLLPRLLALNFSTALAVYVWFGSPSWLSPDPVPLPPLPEERAAVAASVWLGTQEVETFRHENGRLPGVQEVGPLPPGVRYERLDARRFLLVGKGDRVIVPYTDGDPMEELRNAAARLLDGAGDE